MMSFEPPQLFPETEPYALFEAVIATKLCVGSTHPLFYFKWLVG